MLSITKSLSVKVLGLATKTLGKPDEKLVTKAMLTTPSHPITLMASSPQNFCTKEGDSSSPVHGYCRHSTSSRRIDGSSVSHQVSKWSEHQTYKIGSLQEPRVNAKGYEVVNTG